jgi:hypothetical protein
LPMIEKLLGTSAKVSAARVLVANPDRSFSLNELASASGCSPSTLYQQLDDLIGIVAERTPEGIRVMKGSPLIAPLKRLFSVEKKLQAQQSIFEALSRLGRYYVTGSSGLYLRGLGRDFAPRIEKYLIICERRVAKSRGTLLSGFSEPRLRLVEDRISPADYDEIEVLIPSVKVKRLPVAVPERAIADSLWRMADEGSDVAVTAYAVLEKIVDMELAKKYARKRGALVEARMRWLLNEINRAARRPVFDLSGLGSGPPRIPRSLVGEIEGAIMRVLGS